MYPTYNVKQVRLHGLCDPNNKPKCIQGLSNNISFLHDFNKDFIICNLINFPYEALKS